MTGSETDQYDHIGTLDTDRTSTQLESLCNAVIQTQSSGAMLPPIGFNTSATLRPSAMDGVMSASSRPLCFFAPGRPCCVTACRGDPEHFTTEGHLKTTGYIYGGKDERSERHKKRLAIVREQCPACFRYFHGLMGGDGYGYGDSTSQGLADSRARSDRHNADLGTRGDDNSLQSDIRTSVQQEPAPSSTVRSDLSHSTAQVFTKQPELGPIEHLIDMFNKTDTSSITSTVNSIYRFYAQAQICDIYLRLPNVDITEAVRAEGDRACAIRLARELEPKLLLLLDETFVKCIQLALKHVNAVTDVEKRSTNSAYMLVAMPFFKNLKGGREGPKLTKALLECLFSLKKADQGEAGAQKEYYAAAGAFLKRLA